MPDKFSKEVRSHIMSQIKGTGTKLEKEVMRRLWNMGLRFKRNDRSLFGQPDLSFRGIRTVIFIDSCFWHGCPLHYKRPKSNQEYWDQKYNRNRERDVEVNEYYESIGWGIMRVWEHDLKSDPEGTLTEIFDFIGDAKKVMKGR